MSMTIKELQKLLRDAGFDPGPIDGIAGAMTRAAVRDFQEDRGLDVDGIAGDKTIAALTGHSNQHETVAPLPWLAEARRHLGLQEGTKTADKLMRLDTAQIPWCGAFVAMCMGALPREPLPANPLWARDWAKFGKRIEAPAMGAVAVFSRGPTSGHVGFVAGHDAGALHILGGNQSNRVSITKIAKARLLGYRWPTSWPLPGGILPHSTLAGTLSTNEA